MWRRHRWLITVAVALVLLSAALHVVHYAIFRNAQHVFIYLLGDVAFVPLEVLLVAVVLQRLLARQERQERLRKQNMPIGMFFTEIGTELLGTLIGCVENRDELQPRLAVGSEWSARDFEAAAASAATFDYHIDLTSLDLVRLREFLSGRRDMLLMLLANANLLEHERFTDLLWAISHLMAELAARPAFEGLPPSDLDHLAGDVRRVCARLTTAWLRYCRHLQQAYPYIFSIVVRTHPLQEHPDPIVRA